MDGLTSFSRVTEALAHKIKGIRRFTGYISASRRADGFNGKQPSLSMNTWEERAGPRGRATGDEKPKSPSLSPAENVLNTQTSFTCFKGEQTGTLALSEEPQLGGAVMMQQLTPLAGGTGQS